MDTTFKWFGVTPTRVAEILRQSRDLMNNNGRHWVKGDEKVNIDAVDPVTKRIVGLRQYHRPIEDIEYAYCSIGAIREVAKTEKEINAAAFELAKAIDPKFINNLKERWAENWVENYYDGCYYAHGEECDGDCEPTTPTPTTIDLLEYLNEWNFEWAEELITNNNDDNTTKWSDVRNWFTLASKRVSQRKG